MTTQQVTVNKRTIEMSHGKTVYFEAGSGHPVLLLHGSGIEQGGADFLPSMGMLARGFRVLAPNLLGWPPTETLEDIASFPYLVDFLREFQDVLGIRSSHVVGVSMGAWLAGIFAYESPQRVDRVVITGNPGLRGAPNERLLRWQAPEAAAVRQWIQGVANADGVDADALVEEKLKGMQEAGVTEAFARLMRHMGTTANRRRYAMDRRLPFIQSPMLHLWGKEDPHVAEAETWHKLCPGSALKLVQAGHRLHVAEPSLFAEAVLEFLARE